MGLRPTFRLTANSQDITARIADRFICLRLTDESGLQSDTLEVELSDHDPAQPIEMPATGAELELWLGYDGQAQRMVLFVVDEVELSGWPGVMTIRARAAAWESTPKGKADLQTQKVRSWPAGTTLGALVKKIALEHGLEPAVAPSLASIALPHIDQTEESDISFLVRVSKRYDAVVKPAGGKLILAKRGESKTVGGADLPAITLQPADVSGYRLTLARRESPGTVVAYWHSKRSAHRIEIKLGSGEPVRRLRHYYPTEAMARSAAQAELDKRARGEHKVSLTLPGRPDLLAEGRLVLQGFRAGVAGEWLITRVEHSLSPGEGYRCSVEGEKPNEADGEG